MSAHRTLNDMFRAFEAVGPGRVEDPGDAETITIAMWGQFCSVVTTGVETRTLAQPTKPGILCAVGLKTDGGTMTLTVTGGYNADADTTLTYADAGDFAVFYSIDNGGTYYWRPIAGVGSGITELQTDAMDIHAMTGLGAVPAVTDRLAISDESAAGDPTLYVTATELLSAAGDLTDLAAAPTTTDRLLVTDESVAGDPAKSMSVLNLFNTLTAGLTSFTGAVAPATDQMLIDDAGTAKRSTFQVIFNGMANLTAAGAGAVAADELPYLDGGVAETITIQNLFNVSDLTAMSGAIAPAADEIILQDAGTAKSCTYQVFMDGVDDLTALASLPAITDSVLIDDGGTAKKLTIQYLFDGINGLTALAAAPDVADTLMIADESVANDPAKTITMQNLFDGIASLGDYSGTVVPGTDEVYISDAGTVKACTFQIFMDGMEDLTAAGAGAVAADKLVYLDGGVAENITVQNLFNVSDLTATAGPIDPAADELILQDAGVAESCTYQTFMDGVNDLTALGAAPAVTDSVLLDDAGTAKKLTVANLHLAYHGTASAAGAGFGDGETLVTSVETNGTITKTTILIDLTGQESGGAADDIIGDDGESAAYFTQITAAVNGAVFAGKMTCLETPAGGDDDINLSMASVGTGAEDADVKVLTNYAELIDGGNQATGTITYIDSAITADYYLYLSGGTGGAATYSAGKFMLELWGK